MAIVYDTSSDVYVDNQTSRVSSYGSSWSNVGGNWVRNYPSSTPQAVSSQSTPQPTGASPQVVAAAAGVDSRRAYAASFTGWDNDAGLRAIQVKNMDIYIATGRWDTPEQLQLHLDAEAARKAINVTYKGSAYGTLNKAAADALILPDNQPNVTGVSNSVTGAVKSVITGITGATGAQTGGLVKAGLGVGALLLVFSMFKGRG